MHIGITYDLRDHYRSLGFSEEDVAEFDSIATIDAIDNTLRELDFQTERIGTVRHLAESLVKGNRWDVVFNIAEGIAGIGREAQVPALCDAYSLPYTFSDPCVLSLTLNKELAKRIVRDLGLATPDFKLVRSVQDLDDIWLRYPLFAKPYAEGTGKGINAASLIQDRNALIRTCTDLLSRYKQPVLVEKYLPGREFTVGILGSGNDARVIGIMEVILKKEAEAGAYSYSNKENCEETVLYNLADDSTAGMAADLALNAWRGIGCLDAGRVDIRCDDAGIPHFIEVNPLAGLHPEHSDLPMICTKAGISYFNLIGTIVNSCLKRYGLLGKAPEKLKQVKMPGSWNIQAGSDLKKRSIQEKVVVLHQHVPEDGTDDERDVLVQAEEIADSLRHLGYEPVKIGVTLDLDSVKNALLRIKPFKVFNLVESVGGYDRLIGIIPALLDSLSVEYTGSRTEAIELTSSKILAKRIMKQWGISTPLYYLISGSEKASMPEGEYIIKSVSEHASAWISDDSIIKVSGDKDPSMFKDIIKRYKSECYAEEFIDGREFNISILDGPGGIEILPIAEIIFSEYPEGKPRIIGYQAKWDAGSFEYMNTFRRYDFTDEDSVLLGSLKDIAVKCWEIFELRGYGRIDFRVNKTGKPWVLEVNCNPCLSSDAGFMAAAGRKGIARDEVIKRILDIQ